MERGVNEAGLVFLVAEKDMGLRASLVETLKGMGFSQTMAAVNGAQAWATFNSHAPHLVLAGFNLGDITGVSLLKLARAHREFAQTPFVLISEMLTKSQALEAAAAGVSDLMRRPINAARLKERIDALLAQAYDAQGLQLRRLHQEGLALVRAGDLAKAGKVFSVLAGAAAGAEAHYQLGCVLARLGHPREAAASLARAVELDPFFRRASQKLGETLLALGQDAEAEPHLARALEMFLAQLQDPESALSVFNEARQPGSGYFAVFDSLGIIYRRQGRYQEALDLYTKAQAINPKDGAVRYHIGRAYYEIGKYGEAARELRKALELNSGSAETQRLLKVVEARLAAAR